MSTSSSARAYQTFHTGHASGHVLDFTSFKTALQFLADEAASTGKGGESNATYEAMCTQVADHAGCAPSTAGTTKTATGFGSVFANAH